MRIAAGLNHSAYLHITQEVYQFAKLNQDRMVE